MDYKSSNLLRYCLTSQSKEISIFHNAEFLSKLTKLISNDTVFILALPCPALNLPDHIANKQQDMLPRYFNDNISITCEPGYELKGNDTLKCIFKDQKIQWSSELPECIGKQK